MNTQNSEPEFDLSFLEEIADGNQEFMIESITMFLTQTPEILASLTQSIGARDWPTTSSLAHKIKSNLGFFGMDRLKSVMQDIETTSKAGGTDPAISTKFESLKTAVNISLEQLSKIKKQKEAEV